VHPTNFHTVEPTLIMPRSQGLSRTPSKGSKEGDVASPPEKDVEAAQDPSAVNQTEVNPREGISQWQWWLTLVGLYLGALLYGMYLQL
jgi:hypothetical protein